MIPPTYVDGSEAPFMVVQDAHERNPIVNSINNLIAGTNHPFPPVIAVMANQRVAVALKVKGYLYRFVFAKGAGH